MKKLRFAIVVSLIVAFGFNAVAFAQGLVFAPADQEVSLSAYSQVFISIDGSEIKLVIQPEFYGSANEYMLVLPFPSLPIISTVSEDIFSELKTLTGATFGTEYTSAPDIIDSYDMNTFSAQSAEALFRWLKQNDYELSRSKRNMLKSYESDTGYYVTMQFSAEQGAGLNVHRAIKPVQFQFVADEYTLPLRLLVDSEDEAQIITYALSEEYNYIPGATVHFSRKVTADNINEIAPSLQNYDAWRKWLVRSDAAINTSLASVDVPLLTTGEALYIAKDDNPLVLNPEMLPAGTGIRINESDNVHYSSEPVEREVVYVNENPNPITYTMVIALAALNVVWLILLINKRDKRSI